MISSDSFPGSRQALFHPVSENLGHTKVRAPGFCQGFIAVCWLLFQIVLMSNLLPNAAAQQIEFQPSTTVQLPVFGVAVDSNGVLEHAQFAPAGGHLFFQRARAAVAQMDQNLLNNSPQRKVSLRRLQNAIRHQRQIGQPLTDTMLKLAGLQRIEYVFAMPEQNDIVIAGPAEGWVNNAGDRAVGITTGRPVMLLQDLVTALRIYSTDQAANTWVGCSIGSTKEGLKRLSELQRALPSQISVHDEREYAARVVPAIEKALGNATVTVFGAPPKTNMARVMLEADYRMKLIAIGREPPPIKMPTFIGRLKGVPKNNFQRWWFTPDYQCVQLTPDRQTLHMVGQGVQLGTEEYKQDGQGGLLKVKSKPLRAAKIYADAFTKNYDKIAAASPVFGQLRNMVDLLIVANFLRRERLFEKVSLEIPVFLDNDQIATETWHQVGQARSLANAVWKGNRMVAPSGGVSILAAEALRDSNLLPLSAADQKRLKNITGKIALPGDDKLWWWD